MWKIGPLECDGSFAQSDLQGETLAAHCQPAASHRNLPKPVRSEAEKNLLVRFFSFENAVRFR